MSVESEILRIQHNIASAYAKVSGKGGEVPLQPTSANLAAAIASIPVGSELTAGDGLSKEGDTLSVTTPVRGIVTQAEFDALPEAQKNSGLYVISDGSGEPGGGESAGEIYSTKETRIGTWIDGKPVYQQTFSFMSPSTETADNAFSVPNIGSLIQLYGYMDINGGFIPIPFYNGTALISVWYNKDGGVMRIQVTSDVYYSRQCYLTLRYTKTTDEGGAA